MQSLKNHKNLALIEPSCKYYVYFHRGILETSKGISNRFNVPTLE
jgi:hypothetical protein